MFSVRPYEPRDREAVRSICVDTVWLGAPAADAIPGPSVWAEFWTRYFVEREPEHTWIAADDDSGRVLGYLTATTDSRRFSSFLIGQAPHLAFSALARGGLWSHSHRRALVAMGRSWLLGELVTPTKIRQQFPAMFHLHVAADARGKGVASQLIEPFLATMERAGVRGVHVQTSSLNRAIARLLQRARFQLAARWAIRAWEHHCSARVELLTWILPIGTVCSAATPPR